MSQETLEWLNNNTLIGYTAKYGHAWHFDDSVDNHYDGPVPVDDVLTKLFSFEAIDKPLEILVEGLPDLPSPNQMREMTKAQLIELLQSRQVKTTLDPTRKAILRSDNLTVLGVHGPTRATHQYQDWLVKRVGEMLDSDLNIGSAGMLAGGAIAWVQVELDESVSTPEGVEFRPHLLAKTSHDGHLSTSYGRSITNTVCDNTMAIASTEHNGQIMRVKHTVKSDLKLEKARDAVGIVFKMADEFAAEVSSLCGTKVSDEDFDRFLQAMYPVPDKDGSGKTQRLERHATLRGLWKSDERVAPWTGTAWGALQCINTAQQHVFATRGDREVRNLNNKMYGYTAKQDKDTLDVLSAVLSA